jgi:hypothetical protein
MSVLPLAGHRADWYRNVVAGGLVAGSCRGQSGELRWRLASVSDARDALDDYRGRHRLYTRVLLAVVARLNGLSGTPSGELAGALPVLVFRFEPAQP